MALRRPVALLLLLLLVAPMLASAMTISEDVGIHKSPAAGRALDVQGDVAWTGSLLEGGIPFSRLTGAPRWQAGEGLVVTGGVLGNPYVIGVDTSVIGACASSDKIVWDGGNHKLACATDLVTTDAGHLVTGTLADARLSSNVALLDAAQTLSSKTLLQPAIADFTHAAHDHQDAAGGGTLDVNAATTGTLSVTRGGTGSSSLFSPGSIVFMGSGGYGQDNANLLWDDANDRLGIGTGAPAERLHVAGNVRWTGALLEGSVPWSRLTGAPSILAGAGLTGGGDLSTSRTLAIAPGGVTSAMIQDGSIQGHDVASSTTLGVANLGVGTTTPATKLQVLGGTDAALSGGGFLVTGPLTGSNLVIDDNEILARNNGAGSPLFLQLQGGPVMVGTSLGIGTATPSTKLEVRGGGDASLSSHGYVVLGSTTGENIVFDVNEIIARNNGAASPLYLNDASGPVVVSSGVLGVGTLTPAHALDVLGGARLQGPVGVGKAPGTNMLEVAGHVSAAGRVEANALTLVGGEIQMDADGPDGDQSVYFRNGGDPRQEYLKWSEADEMFHVSDDLQILGNVDVRTLDATNDVVARGRVSVGYGEILMNMDGPDTTQHIYFYDGGSPTGEYISWREHDDAFRVSNDLIVDGTVVHTSSIRYKENVETLQDALATVAQLRGVSYDRKEDGRHEVGLIAEEVALVVPEIVVLDENGTPAGVDYSRLVAVLVEAVKEQQAQDAEQDARLAALEAALGVQPPAVQPPAGLEATASAPEKAPSGLRAWLAKPFAALAGLWGR